MLNSAQRDHFFSELQSLYSLIEAYLFPCNTGRPPTPSEIAKLHSYVLDKYEPETVNKALIEYIRFADKVNPGQRKMYTVFGYLSVALKIRIDPEEIYIIKDISRGDKTIAVTSSFDGAKAKIKELLGRNQSAENQHRFRVEKFILE